MADDPIRTLFGDPTPMPPIDVQEVVWRSRRRRLPARVAVATTTSLAGVACIVGAVWGAGALRSGSGATATSLEDSAGAVPVAPSVPPTYPPACGDRVPEQTTSNAALHLAVDAGTARVQIADIDLDPIRATISPHPLLELARDGRVVATSPLATTAEGLVLDLGPKQSVALPAQLLEGWTCGGGPIDPPPGDYQLVALLPDPEYPSIVLVSAAVPVTLR